MGDIDFDELDKAVNSLMSSTDAPSVNTATPSGGSNEDSGSSSKARLAVPTRQLPPQPSMTTPKPSENLRPSTTPPASAAPAVRRSGRFMDVVDSSSELNPLKRPLKDAPTAPNRAKSVIKPVNDIVIPEVADDLKPEPVEQSKINNDPGDSIVVRKVTKDSTMPDPLDVLQQDEIQNSDNTSNNTDDSRPINVFGNNSAPAAALNIDDSSKSEETTGARQDANLSDLSRAIQEQLNQVAPDETEQDLVDQNDDTSPRTDADANLTAQPEEVTVQSVTKEETSPNTESMDEPDTPVAPVNDSPFIADAKPNKRPLNANPTSALETDLPSEDTTESSSEASSEAEDEPYEPPRASDTTAFGTQVPELSSELVAIEATGKFAEEGELPSTSGLENADNKINTPADSSEKIVGPTSITQQYHPKESTGDTSHAPIYDATQYPDPVKHPAKKLSSWWILISVLLLLALGSGGAVALYFMGIIP